MPIVTSVKARPVDDTLTVTLDDRPHPVVTRLSEHDGDLPVPGEHVEVDQ